MRLILFSFFVSIFTSLTSFAQEFIVQGKVTDASSGDPIPFVNVIFKGTGTGATTDFDGNFLIKSLRPTDSVMASYIGYKPKTKAIRKGVRQQILNFQLEEDVTNLQEVVVKAGENPAFTILRGVVDNKSRNDKRLLSAYEYDSYTKMEVDVDHISDKFREKKVMRKISQVLDSIDRVAGEDGKPILPLFITESVSKIYFRDNPSFKTEEILHTKITGVGVEDGSTVNQLVGSSFQEYNFYQNWLPILGKNFVSPIADGWRLYYDYDLLDSLMVGDDFCYRLDFYPKNPLELAFTGSMWIAKKNFALKQIDATVGKEANINFIEKIKIQQELTPLEEGPWMPVKNRILINISELSKNSAGMLAKFYTSNKNFSVNAPKAVVFYDQAIRVKEDATVFTENEYWDSLRHEPLSKTEQSVYKMIDTLRNIPIVRTYTEIFKALVDGYYDFGKIEVGPYLRTIAYNNVEGTRVSLGFKTNRKFDKQMLYSGFLAYGFNDQQVKYMTSAQRILSRRRWTTATVRVGYDMIRLGIDDDALNANPLFLTAARWGNFRRGYYYNEGYASLQRELFRGFSQKISMRHWTFDPSYRFGALQDPTDPNSEIIERFQTSEVTLETRYGRDETFIQNGNERISTGPRKWPIFTLRYTHGFKDVFGSDYEFNRLRLLIDKRTRLGPLGVGLTTLTAEHIFETLPYPLLGVHLGNQSPVYAQFTYNLMNFGEFVSDSYVSIRHRQYLEGFLINKIPLLNKLKWRLVGTANIIYGSLREPNRQLISEYTRQGEFALRTLYFTGTPYVELGYGVENIFKLFRVDFVHRITYLDNPDARPFGILFTIQFKL